MKIIVDGIRKCWDVLRKEGGEFSGMEQGTPSLRVLMARRALGHL